jgi:hypothetical protein
MREFCEYGSVRGALRNERPYRERHYNVASRNHWSYIPQSGSATGLSHVDSERKWPRSKIGLLAV